MSRLEIPTIPPEWEGLPLTIYVSDQHHDFFIRNQIAVVVESRGISRRWAAQQVFHREFFLDSAFSLEDAMFTMFDRMVRPWAYFKTIPFPQFDLFPRWTRFRNWTESLRKSRVET